MVMREDSVSHSMAERRDWGKDKRRCKTAPLFLLLLPLQRTAFHSARSPEEPTLQLYVHVLHTVNKAICKRVYEAPGFMIFVFLHVKTSKAKNCEHISLTISLFPGSDFAASSSFPPPACRFPPLEPIRRLTASFFNTIKCSDESAKT